MGDVAATVILVVIGLGHLAVVGLGLAYRAWLAWSAVRAADAGARIVMHAAARADRVAAGTGSAAAPRRRTYADVFEHHGRLR